MPNAPPAAAGAAGRPGGGQPPSHSVLRAFTLSSGQVRASYRLPGATSLCNDISIAPDRTVFISDTSNGRVLRLDRHAGKLEIWLQDSHLMGIDGLTFLGSALYANSVQTGHLYRLPMGSAGRSGGAPVDIALSQPLQGPDGMRAANGRIYVAENRAGRISELTLDGDRATVRVIKDGYQMPTAVSPVGGVLWVGEAKLNYLFDAKLRGQDPGPFKAYALALP
jgi:sugar lactone lactonase YvrE